jgi:thiol-disulfide isomerase/thioredoxin
MSSSAGRLRILGIHGLVLQALAMCGLAMGQTGQGGPDQPGAYSPPNRYYNPSSKSGAATPAAGAAGPMARGANPQPGTRSAATSPRAAAPARPGYGPTQRSATPPKSAAKAAPRAQAPAAAAQPAEVPSPQQALKLTPVQKDIDYSRPTEEEVAKCKVLVFNQGGQSGWVVEDPQGLILRKYLDTNGDNKVDQWCYYKDGLEVYRDIDGDFDGRVDQYRWFHTAGSRWALDKDEDGVIDAWNAISAEEASAEVVAALAAQDADRFARVLLTPAEAQSLGLGQAKAKELLDKVRGAAAKFKQLAEQSKTVTAKTRWAQFGGSQPGVVPAGTDGSARDVLVYENVLAMVQTGSEHGQLQIGTLVKVGEAWKVIDAPQAVVEGQTDLAASGFFFRVAQDQRSQVAGGGLSEKTQELLGQLEKLDAAAAQATSPEQQAAANSKRADLLERMVAEAAKPEDRAMWLRQLADMLSAAVQSGAYPEGAKRLDSLLEAVQRSEQDKTLAGYVKFRQLTGQYGLAVQAKGADFAKIQTEWLKKLEQYVADYPRSPDCVEAMLQLGMAQEFAGQDEEAKKWYGRIASDFPDSPESKKAAGARTRLDSVGKVITLQGKSPGGEAIDLAKLRGQVVLIQYWATTSEQCKADMAAMKEFYGKYGPSGFSVIGVNLDNDLQTMNALLSENRLPWPQIFEPGGRDSRLAVELGVLTLPTMILVDQEGKVVSRNVTVTELGAELKKLIR